MSMSAAKVVPSDDPPAVARPISAASDDAVTRKQMGSVLDAESNNLTKAALKEQRIIFSGAEGKRKVGHMKSVLCVTAIDIVGKDTLVVSGGEGKVAHVWSLRAGKHITILEGHIQRISAVASYVTPSGKPFAITGSWDESVRIWDIDACFDQDPVKPASIKSVETGEGGPDSDQHANRVLSLAVVEPRGKPPLLVSGSADNSLKVWSLPKGEYQYELRDKERVTYFYALGSYEFRDQSFVVSGCRDNTVKVWALRRPVHNDIEKYARSTPVMVIEGHPSRVHSLQVIELPDSSHKSADEDDAGEVVGTTATVVTACKDLILRVFSLHTGLLLRVMTGAHSNLIRSLSSAVLPDVNEAYVVSTSESGNICVWRYSTGEKERFFNGHIDACTCSCALPSPGYGSELLVVSGGADRSVRTWLVAEEASVIVRENKTPLLALGVYCDSEDNTVVITGCEKGRLQAENLMRIKGNGSLSFNKPYPMGWHIKDAHISRVRTVSVYTPNEFDNHRPYKVPPDSRFDISKPLVLSGGRGCKLRVAYVDTGLNAKGENDYLLGHTSVISSSAVFQGRCWFDQRKCEREILPFVVTGGEDDTVRVWELHSGNCINVLRGHELDVLSVAIYVPPDPKKARRGRSGLSTPAKSTVSAPLSRKGKKNLERDLFFKPNIPVIISAGMDNSICIWAYEPFIATMEEEDSESEGDGDEKRPAEQKGPQSRHLIAKIAENTTHFNCVGAMETNGKYDPSIGPVILAGGGDNHVHVWSLWPPYEKITELKGHTDEVQCMNTLPSATYGSIAATGSWDKTVRIWSMQSMQCLRIVEGHTQEITSVHLFQQGGGDPSLVSVSGDKKLRVLNDCLGGIPKVDFVTEQFFLDLQSEDKPRSTLDEVIAWPRIGALVDEIGVESFFSQFYSLFGLAVKHGSHDFVAEYFPQCELALLKCNVPYKDSYDDRKGISTKEIDAAPRVGSLIFHCINRRDIRSLRVVVSRWIEFLTVPATADTDLIFDERALLHKDDLLLIAETFPKEFERLICNLTLIPWKVNSLPPGKFSYFVEESHHLFLRKGTDILAPTKEVPHFLLFLPVQNLCHIELLEAYSACCESLDSVMIFDSDAGQLALSYCWNSAGLRVHTFTMVMYLLKVVMATISIYTFDRSVDTDYMWPSVALVCCLLALDGYFLYMEIFEFLSAPLRYFTVIWNVVIGVVMGSGLIGNILRLVYLRDTLVSRTALSITSIFMWTNVLYYLRAFEATGPLVSMIIRISKDMQPFLIVLMLSIIGFSQAFWLVSNDQIHDLDDDPPFRTIANSLLFSFSSTLGDFNPGAFEGMPLEHYGIVLTCLFTLVSSILLLNLLIALMGDSYGAVKEKGLAQWRLEQADLILESSSRMTEEERSSSSFVFFKRKTDDLDDDVVKNQFNMEHEIKSMKVKMVELKSDMQHVSTLTELMKDLIKKVDRIEHSLEEEDPAA